MKPTMPWDDHSNLERHYCHKHEVFQDELTGVSCCEICRDAKVAAYFRKQKLQKEAKNER